MKDLKDVVPVEEREEVFVNLGGGLVIKSGLSRYGLAPYSAAEEEKWRTMFSRFASGHSIAEIVAEYRTTTHYVEKALRWYLRGLKS